MPAWANEIVPIAILLAVVAIVMSRLPNVEEVDHSRQFRKRRVQNWLPLGLTYAFLYMGRYNLKISKFAFEDLVNTKLRDIRCRLNLTNAEFAVVRAGRRGGV